MGLRLYEIGENLYVSAWPDPEGVPHAQEFGITRILCLSKKDTPPEYHEAGMPREYRHIPDGKVLPVEELRVIVSRILELLESGETVLVHCLQGRNRSMIAALLAERKRQGWTGEETYQHGQAVRPACLHNPVFADWLRSLP